ncbi:1-deoxy-D-xylulose-5-phosphate reductoisomerase [Anaerotalea alkaliphila]|uniref:1-deoxy-D-xylulose 5-phosphate reductoisomerase n=1 Tax=Anaerotalea alkaliphila TaxID=2662126 RepID=A0A7X5HT52_9FIRM|nr:1-deoxy-D-xylulose-5-phosphate reductoisomerase [Anaerotalea alkaliphila]NDL66163.1 1-deoxy-D-xylulose-5-phosphate reductoisomerase [Anaerotalea alkaliphila]
MKRIAIMGSTGSIGSQTLEIAREQGDLEVLGLSAHKDVEGMLAQVLEFNPRLAVMMDPEAAVSLELRLAGRQDVSTAVLSGMDGLLALATLEDVEMLVTAVVGMIGIRPTLAAIAAGKDIALANKETLVTAGKLVMDAAKEHGVRILPVDSEHSALFQSMHGEDPKSLESLILTASGGPFRGRDRKSLESVTVAEALRHPNWAMGSKITIDSATLMNKGLEVIEAGRLFGVEGERIQVVVHPESIVHSLASFRDGSVIAQLGLPDMRLPIQYALYYPERRSNRHPRLDLAKIRDLHFEEPDRKTFRLLDLAYGAMAEGKTMTTVLNAANEKAVALFLEGKIRFLDIQDIIEDVLERHLPWEPKGVEDILEAERWTWSTIESRWKY